MKDVCNAGYVYNDDVYYDSKNKSKKLGYGSNRKAFCYYDEQGGCTYKEKNKKPNGLCHVDGSNCYKSKACSRTCLNLKCEAIAGTSKSECNKYMGLNTGSGNTVPCKYAGGSKCTTGDYNKHIAGQGTSDCESCYPKCGQPVDPKGIKFGATHIDSKNIRTWTECANINDRANFGSFGHSCQQNGCEYCIGKPKSSRRTDEFGKSWLAVQCGDKTAGDSSTCKNNSSDYNLCKLPQSGPDGNSTIQLTNVEPVSPEA
jgi:hypothetical protein